MVTGPVHKEALAHIEPDFVGQTEFLARACGLPDDAAVMCLTDPKLTVALCSNHCSLRDALKRLTPKRIIHVAKVTREFSSVAAWSGAGAPSPSRRQSAHGRGGPFRRGRFSARRARGEETPSRRNRHRPCAADTVFHYAVNRRAFDAVICAYHDQGLIPFKLVAFETGVNVTLGLPIIRTSPDHGTALDIAGQNKADHRSMLAAVRLACRLAKK